MNCSVVFSSFLIFKNNHGDYISIKLEGNSIVQKYSPDVDLYALHKLNRYDAV